MDCNDGGCLTAAAMFGVPGIRVLAAGEVGGELHLLVETVERVGGCRSCGVVAAAHRRREHLLRDAPFGHRPVVVMWRKRIFRCVEATCPVSMFSEEHPLAGERAALTGRAITWAADALECDDTTVSALARRLGVGWHTLWRAVKVEAARRADRPGRLDGVATLGVDEHVWRPGRCGAGREVTVMVDLTRGRDGRLRSRLLDIVPGRSGTAYKAWLDAQSPAFRGGVKHAALDPFRGYATPCATACPTRSRCWTPSTSSSSAPKSSMRSAAASSSRPCTGADTSTTRCTRSAACCDTASST
jgi:transposase